MKTCWLCLQPLNGDDNLIEYSSCSAKGCSGIIVDIDDHIIDVTERLLKKGYPTYPSFIHSESLNVSIYFDSRVNPEAFTSIPDNFFSEVCDANCMRLYKLIEGKSKSERSKYIKDASIDLIHWIETLSPAMILKVDFDLGDGIDIMDLYYMDEFHELELLYEDPTFDGRFITIVSPERIKFIEGKVKTFAREIGVKVSITIIDENSIMV